MRNVLGQSGALLKLTQGVHREMKRAAFEKNGGIITSSDNRLFRPRLGPRCLVKTRQVGNVELLHFIHLKHP